MIASDPFVSEDCLKLSPQEILILLDGLSKVDAGWLQLIVVHLKNRLKEEYERQTGSTIIG